jgi:hypothetical protein
MGERGACPQSAKEGQLSIPHLTSRAELSRSLIHPTLHSPLTNSDSHSLMDVARPVFDFFSENCLLPRFNVAHCSRQLYGSPAGSPYST